MRRSGTSLTASVLARLGYFLENNSRPPNEHNPEGYWESKSVLDLNTKILNELGGSELTAPKMVDGWESKTELNGARRTARSLVESYDRHEFWGIKDDRFSLTLPLWKSVFPPAVSYIICVRNPLAVARSMKRMAPRYDPRLLFNLWFSHVAHAILNTQGERRLLVFYEDYIAPRPQILQLCEFLGIEFRTELEFRFKDTLFHERPSTRDFLDAETASLETKLLYVALLGTKSTAVTLDDVGKSLRSIS